MTTRDKILSKAQELFNNNGIRNVSVRSICEELNISLGNFTYYFPDKQKIVIELYQKMITEIENVKEHVIAGKESIQYLLEYHWQVFNIQNRYKFFFLHTFELINNSPEIKTTYLAHIKRDKRRMKELMLDFVKNGVLNQNVAPSFLDRLIDMSMMVNNFWMIDAELQSKGQKRKLVHYLELCCSLIEPYLTPKAMTEYKLFFDKLHK